MALVSTSSHEMLRMANARGMTGVHSDGFDRKLARGDKGSSESRSRAFHDAARYHEPGMTKGIRDQKISKNVGTVKEKITPKTENAYVAN
jgi:hypothetical protein